MLLLQTVGNTEFEKAVRAKNRHEEQKTKEDKAKEAKIRLKKTEKKRMED